LAERLNGDGDGVFPSLRATVCGMRASSDIIVIVLTVDAIVHAELSYWKFAR
jgi:hypothetical protein